jgi:hypothetical protein
MARFGEPVETNAVDALVGLLKKQAGHVAWLEARIGLDRDGVPLPDGPALAHVNTTVGGGESLVVHPLLVLLRDERDQLRRVSVECIRLGLKEIEVGAMVAAVRREAGEVVALLRAVVEDPRLVDVADRVRVVVMEQLQARSTVPVAASSSVVDV